MAEPENLQNFVENYRSLFVLTGAGCSTRSGIPDYRDAAGQWKRQQPMSFRAFMGADLARRRYWARSLLGWRRFRDAAPNETHRALARLEAMGRAKMLVTQNVDRLHQAAGSARVIDLHGRLDQILCMACGWRGSREKFQVDLERLNPDWGDLAAASAPDGNSDFDGGDFSSFSVPACARCGGMLKPDVVFFGENVPREKVAAAARGLEQAEAVLVVGSSLMVYSGFRFAEYAARLQKPIAAINLGRTRADSLLALKVEQRCEQALAFLL